MSNKTKEYYFKELLNYLVVLDGELIDHYGDEDLVHFFKDELLYFEIEPKEGIMWARQGRVWDVLKNKYMMNDIQINSFIIAYFQIHFPQYKINEVITNAYTDKQKLENEYFKYMRNLKQNKK